MLKTAKQALGSGIALAAVLVCMLGSGAAAFPAESADKNSGAASVASGSNAFALDMYGIIRKKDGNLFFSPFSISTALAMTYAGARGQTAKQMKNILHIELEFVQLSVENDWRLSFIDTPQQLNIKPHRQFHYSS
jgi:serine protease inhibitor